MVTRDNHFIPQWLLKRWSPDGVAIWTYSLVVPHANVPYWELKSIRGSAFRRDLYTTLDDGDESDAIEKWITSEIEHPGLEASERLISGTRLTRDDWHALIRFYALQEFRTPLSFMEFMRRWEQYLPDLIEKSLKEAIQIITLQKATGSRTELRESNEDDKLRDSEFSRLLKVTLEESTEDEYATLGATVTAGRALWMYSIRRLMHGQAMDKLLSHEWSILSPAEGSEWPLTDHPSLRVGFRSEQDYSFDGGWGRRNTDLAIPLSPHHLLHVQVGNRSNRFTKVSPEHTRIIQALLVNRAFRFIYATLPGDGIPRQRQRIEDAKIYQAEMAAWEGWHSAQSQAETG